MNAAEMTIKMRNMATEQWYWFSDAAIERAVPCNGGPDDSMYVAVMPEDWPEGDGEFSDEGNIWYLHDQI